MAAASLFLQVDDLQAAEDHAKLALDPHPSFANGLLARVALRRDEFEHAETLARRALDEDTERLGPRITLANVLHARSRYEEAYQEEDSKSEEGEEGGETSGEGGEEVRVWSEAKV